MLLQLAIATTEEGSKLTAAESTPTQFRASGVFQGKVGSLRDSVVWQQEAAKRQGFAFTEEEWPLLGAGAEGKTTNVRNVKGGGNVSRANVNRTNVKRPSVKGRRQTLAGASSLTVLASRDFAVAIDTHENLKLTIAMQRKGSPNSTQGPLRSVQSSPSVLVHSEEEIDLSGTFFVRLFDMEYAELAGGGLGGGDLVGGVTGQVPAGAGECTDSVYSVVDGRVFVGYFYPQVSFHSFQLGLDATRVCREPNAGGQSTVSESLSVEYFVRSFRGTNVITEMEVGYCNPNWKKVDYIIDIFGARMGVSVTRAMSFPNPSDFSEDDARRLLIKKLYGLVVAQQGVAASHTFMQSILHVWCETARTASIIQRVYPQVALELDTSDTTVVVLTVAEGQKARPIFYENVLWDRRKFGVGDLALTGQSLWVQSKGKSLCVSISTRKGLRFNQ